MNTLKQKLSSRKLWAAIVGVVVGLAAAFGIDANEYAQVAGIVTSALSVFAYIFGEASVDAAREKYGIDLDAVVASAEKMEEKAAEAEEDPTAEK
jgi:phage shock protein PspC (stress-responsive transcriptional regulator)